MFSTFFFQFVNEPSSEVFFFIFAIALVRWAWLSATGTTEVPFLTIQARVDGPGTHTGSITDSITTSRFDKEVMLRAFRLVHLQRKYNYRIKLNFLHLSAGADQPSGLVHAGTLRDPFWNRTKLDQVGENHR